MLITNDVNALTYRIIGVYLCRLEAGKFRGVGKLVVMR